MNDRSSLSPETVVQRQLDAYNAHDLVRFLAEYADGIRIYRLPASDPAMEGKQALAEFYATQRFNHAELHADLLNRMVLGSKVIDHERVSGLQEQPFEVAAVYEVTDGLIRSVWFHAP